MGGRGARSTVYSLVSTPLKELPKTIKLPDIEIKKSVGAAYIFQRVKLPDGTIAEFEVGTKLTNIQVIAGHGVSRKIDEVKRLQKKYGGKADEWQKVKADGTIVVDGITRKAELHWYQFYDSPETYDLKVKRYHD